MHDLPLSIIIPTRNEARNIRACLAELHWARDAGSAELIVVDNHSDDDIARLAIVGGARVEIQGPERSAESSKWLYAPTHYLSIYRPVKQLIGKHNYA